MNLTRKETQDNFVTEKIDVYKNNLLGIYDDKGKYFIPSHIVDELIKLPKEQTSSFDNSLFCEGELLGYGKITFQLSFDKKSSDGKITGSSLYLLEAVDKINGYVQNTLKTKIVVFQSTVANFMSKAFEFFNVKTKKPSDNDEEEMERKIVDDEMLSQSYILAKKQYSLFLNKLADEKCLDAYGKYFTARYTALTKMNNPFSNEVLSLFNEEYARIEKFFLRDKNYKILNELLDKCIEEVSGTNESYAVAENAFLEATHDALEAFTENVGKIHEKMGSKALNMLSKDDKEKMEVIIGDEAQRNKENDSPEFTDDVPVFGVRKQNATPKAQKENLERVTKENTKVAEMPQNEPQTVKKEETQKETKASSNVNDIKNRLSAMRQKTEKKAEAPKPKVEKVENTKTAEEKPKEKKNYSELFSYLNEQSRLKKTQNSSTPSSKTMEDDGMDM